MKTAGLLCILLLVSFFLRAQTLPIVYVDSSAQGLNNGSSWSNAFNHLDSALRYSNQNTLAIEIRVAKGTYVPTKKYYVGVNEAITSDIKDRTFHILEGTQIFGGYPSGGGTRNIVQNPTILSGQISSNDQCYHVCFQNTGGDAPVILDGITITGGSCNTGGFTFFPYGAGYYLESEGDIVFNDVTISDNTAWMGGAVYHYAGSAIFTRCNFVNNNAVHLVGGVFSDHGVLNFKACLFQNNTNLCFKTDLDGNDQASNCLFIGNHFYDGGALHVGLSDFVTLRNCTFYGNYSMNNNGGAISAIDPGTLNIYNCIFYKNTSSGNSNDVSWGAPTAINARYCSFQEAASFYPSGMFTTTGYSTLFFNQDPMFIDTANVLGNDNQFRTADDGLHLSGASSCINTGNNGYQDNAYPYDFANSTRIQGTIDRGAYEQDCSIFTGSTSSVTVCGSYTWNINQTTYTTSGIYTAQQACTIYTLNLVVNPLPVISFSGPTTICAGSSTTLTLSGGASYVWVPGSITSNPITLNPTLTTNYTVTATSSAGCTKSVLKQIVVNQLPSVQTTATATSICPGSSTTLTATGTNSYLWQPGNIAGSSITVYPLVNTTYTVTGTSSTTGCSKTSTRLITMKSLPNVTTTATPSSVCSGNASTLTASGANTYVWQPGGANTASIIVNPINTSTYTVTGTSTTSGCSKSVTRTVTVNCGNTLNLKTFIQGYYIGAQQMNAALLNQGQPNTATQTDSIQIELRQTVAPYSVAYALSGVLLTNGNFNAYLPSSTAGNSYYIVVKNRNILETWSKNPVSFSGNTSYDFTNAATKAYGDNLIEVEPGTWAVFSGDLDHDGSIDGFDFLVMYPDIVNGNFGYLSDDIDGDGSVDIFDFILLDPNIINGQTMASP